MSTLKNRNPMIPLLAPLAAALVLTLGCGDDDTTTGQDSGTPDASALDDGGGPDVDGSASDDAGPGGNPNNCTTYNCPEDIPVVYVDHSVASPGLGDTPETAFATLEQGVERGAQLAGACCHCDVLVAEGTYRIYRQGPLDSLRLRDRVSLYGGHPTGFTGARDPDRYDTVITGREAGGGEGRSFHVVTGANHLTFDGFEVTGGDAREDTNVLNHHNYGGGLLNLGNTMTVVDVALVDNRALRGAGMYNRDAQITCRGCIFSDNVAGDRGGGVDNSHSTIVLERSWFKANAAFIGGGLANTVSADATIVNTIFAGNEADENGGAMYNHESSPTLINVTIGYNDAGNEGDGLYNSANASPQVVNSILWGNGMSPEQCHNAEATAQPTIRYSSVEGGCTVASGCTTDETGNVEIVPSFVDIDRHDLRLWFGAAVVDLGNNALLPAQYTEDISGEPRITDGDGDSTATVDLGASEALDRQTVMPTLPIVYVDRQATGADDGSSWNDAFPEVWMALQVAEPYSQIWVAEGNYPTNDYADKHQVFEMVGGVFVFGGFAPSAGVTDMTGRAPATHVTVLTADLMENDAFGDLSDNAYGVVRMPSSGVLDGFTLRGVHAYSSSVTALYVRSDAHVEIRNCRITDNFTEYAAAARILDNSLVRLENCRFDFNESYFSGGGANLSITGSRPGSIIDNCQFENNTTPGAGAALWASGSHLEIVDSVFRDNTSGHYGGALRINDGTVTIRGTNFERNTSKTGGAIYAEYTRLTVEGCSFTDNAAYASGVIDYCDIASYLVTEGSGGAIAALDRTDLDVRSTTFTGNSAGTGEAVPCDELILFVDGVGGAVITRDSTANLNGVVFDGNSAQGDGCYTGAGGAVGAFGSVLRITNGTFTNNTAAGARHANCPLNTPGSGGAVWIFDPIYDPAHKKQSSIANAVFTGNESGWMGGAVFTGSSDTHLFNVTITQNTAHYGGWNGGGGVALYSWGVSSSVHLYNSILAGNVLTGLGGGGVDMAFNAQDTCNSAKMLYAYNTLLGAPAGCPSGCSCTSPLSGDPLFTDPSADPADVTLQTGSICINAGDGANLPEDWHDLDGDGDVTEPLPEAFGGGARNQSGVDCGAYERN
jgi:predicted outer membrane repeat protein